MQQKRYSRNQEWCNDRVFEGLDKVIDAIYNLQVTICINKNFRIVEAYRYYDEDEAHDCSYRAICEANFEASRHSPLAEGGKNII